MKQIENSNEDMLVLLEAVVGIKNELLYIREYFHPDGLIPFIMLELKILFRSSDIRKVLEDSYQH